MQRELGTRILLSIAQGYRFTVSDEKPNSNEASDSYTNSDPDPDPDEDLDPSPWFVRTILNDHRSAARGWRS